MTEYTHPEERTYAQMLEIAKAISPDARVRAIDYGEQKWEIYIPSEFAPTYDLPESYKGTPAWDLSLLDDGSYGDQLSRWGYKNGYRGLPIEGIADYYNVQCEFSSREYAIASELDKSAGFIPMNEITDWKPITREIAAQYMDHKKTAQAEIREAHHAAVTALNEKWGR